MDLIAKLKAGKRNIRKMKFPGTEIEIGLTVLTEAELQEAVFETERYFKKAGIEISATTVGAYDKEQITQTLARAIVNPEKQNPNGTWQRVFSSTDDLRQLFVSQTVKDELVEAYNELQDAASPSPARMSAQEVEILLETVKKNPESLTGLSSSTLKQLLHTMVCRHAS